MPTMEVCITISCYAHTHTNIVHITISVLKLTAYTLPLCFNQLHFLKSYFLNAQGLKSLYGHLIMEAGGRWDLIFKNITYNLNASTETHTHISICTYVNVSSSSVEFMQIFKFFETKRIETCVHLKLYLSLSDLSPSLSLTLLISRSPLH